ncbi:MAG TPA: amidohydrolase family protein [Vicinamibacteria bacterium]|nr:amidohydrolase family protein [Vicinamibacteria bacterium]
MTPWRAAACAALLMAAGGAATGRPAEAPFDLVIRDGRVMDPESGLDAIRHVGVKDGRIAAVSPSPLSGRATIDAGGLIVAPGFIDLHAHGQDAENDALRAADGVTTALELEIGVADVDRFYAARAGRALVHFGASVGHVPVRMAVMGDPEAFLPPATAGAATRPASEAQLDDVRRRIRAGLERGALAVGMGIQYTAAASRFEVVEVFREAARAGASVHVHMRYNGTREPLSSTTALEEVVAAAAITGAPLHVVHLHSTSLAFTARHLRLLEEARGRGLDVTTECYPYTAGMTDLASGVFDEGWRESLGIDYGDLLWAATGERLTAETFAARRRTGGMVAVFSIPEEAVRAALAHPLVMVASDAVMKDGKGHPRSAATNARLLGVYVREQKTLPLMEALRKITLLPALRLERRAPALRDKGRVRVGADADLTLFDPHAVRDLATWTAPATPPAGIPYVIVAGVPVVERGILRRDVLPGRPLRAPIR